MGAHWVGRPGWQLVAEAGAATGRDVAGLLLEADATTLQRTDNAQLATLVLELVVLRELRTIGFDGVVWCAGHSLGEYAALVAAGIMNETTAVRLVDVRGRAMRAAADAREGSMLVVLGLTDEAVRRLVALLAEPPRSAPVWVANLNAPGPGRAGGIAGGPPRRGGPSRRGGCAALHGDPIGGAFHSPFMASALGAVSAALQRAPLCGGHLSVVANVDARPHRAADSWRQLLAEQVIKPVRWREGLDALTGQLGADHLVEIGPGRVLTGFAKRCVRGVATSSCVEPAELDALGDLLEVREATA